MEFKHYLKDPLAKQICLSPTQQQQVPRVKCNQACYRRGPSQWISQWVRASMREAQPASQADLTPNGLHSPPIRFRLSKSWVHIVTWQAQQIIQLVLGGRYAGSSQLLFLFAAYFSDLGSRERKVWPICWRVLSIKKTLSDALRSGLCRVEEKGKVYK